jgi:hypothetical protein
MQPTEIHQRYQVKYGPDGTTLLLAGQATGLPGSALGVVSILLLFISQEIAHLFMGVAVALCAVAFIRGVQCTRAGRKFRRARQASS